MELDFKGAKIPTLTIPKGTLLFRTVRHSEGDFSGADVSPGKRCIPKNYNVFFYMNPYVPDIHPELEMLPNVDVYETPHDLTVVSMVRPSPYSRGSHYKTDKFPMMACDKVEDTCLKGREYDPCFKDEFLEAFPDVQGWVAVGRSDSKKLLDAMKKGSVPKNVHLVKDQRGVEGAMELALYPLRKREMDNVFIEHPVDWTARHEFNYKHVATLKRHCSDRKDFLARRATYHADTGFYTLREGGPVRQPAQVETEESLVLRKQKDAAKVASKCLENMSPAQDPPQILGGLSEMPPQVLGPWGMDMEAVGHTLEYVYGKLHHACYMLCVTGGKSILYKLEERTTAPGFQDALFNKKLKTSMRNRPTRKTQWRVIQCLVKPYSGESTFTDAYARFFNEMSYALPDGVFLMNLTDAVLVKKDGAEPWPMVTGPGTAGENSTRHIPILGGSSQEGYWDIPIPNYDDVQLILGMDKNLVNPEWTNWGRKQNRVVFRGAPTGCGYTTETNMRLKLAKLKSADLDVGVTVVKSNSIKFDPKEGMGQLDMTKELKPVGRLSLEEQSRYKYIIHIDGNVAAYRLLKMMTTGSLILKVKGPYILWVDHLLKDKQHYVEVAADLSDLQTVVQWCRDHDSECEQIARRGMEFAKKALTKDFVDASFAKILWGVTTAVPLSKARDVEFEEGMTRWRNLFPPAPPPDASPERDEWMRKNFPESGPPPKVYSNAEFEQGLNRWRKASPPAPPSSTVPKSRWGSKAVAAPPSPSFTPLSGEVPPIKLDEQESTSPTFGPQKIQGDPGYLNLEETSKPFGFFVCGPPGVGKSSHVPEMLKLAGISDKYTLIDPDLLEGDTHLKKSQKAAELVKDSIAKKESFVYVATCGGLKVMISYLKAMKSNGMKSVVAIPYTKLTTALNRISKREQATPEEVTKDLHAFFATKAEAYMTLRDLEEVYLYNNETEFNLLYSRKNKTIVCTPGEFYFDMSKYCKKGASRGGKRITRRTVRKGNK